MTIEYIVFCSLLLVSCTLALLYKVEPLPLSVEDIERLKTESPIESKLFDNLVWHGYSPMTQYPIGRYRADIAFPAYMLVIECDGKAYHTTPSQRARDRRRDAFMKAKGWTVLRFTGSQINGNMRTVIRKINRTIEESRQAERA